MTYFFHQQFAVASNRGILIEQSFLFTEIKYVLLVGLWVVL